MWTLIIALYSSTGTSVESVPGFETLKHCQAAGKEAENLERIVAGVVKSVCVYAGAPRKVEE
jgi:hypothetical protein